jgi:hypothetical protein
MPQPLSVIWISFFPPPSTLMRMRVAPGVQRVFEQFLHHRSRTLHHLAGGDLVGNALR